MRPEDERCEQYKWFVSRYDTYTRCTATEGRCFYAPPPVINRAVKITDFCSKWDGSEWEAKNG